MIGIRRRKKIEGWAIDVSDSDMDAGRLTPWQRLADNTRLWFAALAAVILISAFFIWQTGGGTNAGGDHKRLAAPPIEAYRDFKHTQFARDFVNRNSYGTSIISAEFVGADFQITLPATASADEVNYTATMAAKLIEHKLKHRAIVDVYTKSASGGGVRLVAITKWNPEKYGYTVSAPKRP